MGLTLSKGLRSRWLRAFAGICVCAVLAISYEYGLAEHVLHSLGSLTHKRDREEVRRVRSEIAPKLNLISDNPRNEEETIAAIGAYARAYSEVNVVSCPADFRKQFYAARQAWADGAIALIEEKQFLLRHPEEDPTQGGDLGLHAAELMRATDTALQNALSQNQELTAVARQYGVDWR